jgi:hypothetical protein
MRVTRVDADEGGESCFADLLDQQEPPNQNRRSEP